MDFCNIQLQINTQLNNRYDAWLHAIVAGAEKKMQYCPSIKIMTQDAHVLGILIPFHEWKWEKE